MMQIAKATFVAKSWQETPYAEREGLPKLSKTSCEQVYRGDLSGESTLAYLMVYDAHGNASFVGLERIVGSIKAKHGSFVLRHWGVFENGVARIELSIVAGTGTGELVGIEGGCTFESPHADEYEIALEYSLDG